MRGVTYSKQEAPQRSASHAVGYSNHERSNVASLRHASSQRTSMERVLRTLFSFRELKSSHDDDVIDRLTRIYTSSLLFLFCVIVTSSHYVGNVIQCWCPAEFTDSHKSYTNTICWVSDTYYVPFHRQIPTNDRQPRQMIHVHPVAMRWRSRRFSIIQDVAPTARHRIRQAHNSRLSTASCCRS